MLSSSCLPKADTRVKRKGYIFVNLGRHPALECHHDKPLHIDSSDIRAPWPILFYIHETTCRVRNPFQPPRQISMPISTHPNAPTPVQLDGPRILPGIVQPQEWREFPPYGGSPPSQGHYNLHISPGSHETHPPAHNTVLSPLPGILCPEEYFSRERMEALGFRNWEDPHTSSDWTGTAMENIEKWKALAGRYIWFLFSRLGESYLCLAAADG